MSAEAGAFVAAGTEANYKVALTWRPAEKA